jgi:hypothetical protein
MSERGEAQAKEDALLNGAKPRLEERVRERGWRPTDERYGMPVQTAEAARPRAIEGGRRDGATVMVDCAEAAK